MVRGARTSPSVTLPKVSFQKTDEDYSLRLFGVHNLQARSYGFNDFSQFQRPKHYIQYIEPIENDLARQVEYDMDEQDQEWLDSVNAERKKEQIDMVSCETFEIIMDRLEKEWFDLTKNIPKTDFAMPSEDSTCAVCDDSEGENSNAIVFCDGCNLAVHQDCYGVPYIPEGQWLCRKCTVSPENPVSCVLCPIEGGAFKQTVTGGWVHLLCAIWVPETRVANEVFMEPITGVDKISKQRWRLKCSLCDIKGGACIQCAKASCFTAFHTTCARKEKLLMPMKSTQGSEPVTLTCYCEKHLPKEQQDAREVALERERIAEESSAALSKSARAYAKTYKPGPPVVPALIINRILNYIAKVQLRKRQEFVQMVARYWSLKREARRGAPLLKRLHLEPWTANGGNGQSDEDKEMKLQLLLRLREDLENVHEMTTLTRKRESRKQAQATVIRDTLLSILAPFEHLLRDSFNRIITVDRNEYFRHPVSKTEVPDYFDVVKKPMYWSMIEEKINNHSYFGSQEFKDDITLVIDNAILYNQLNTAYHKTAVRIRSAMQPIFEELDHRLAAAKAGVKKDIQPAQNDAIENGDVAQPTNDTDENGNVAQHANDTTENGNVAAMAIDTSIGDLEPPFEFLKLLTSIEAIQEETELLLDKNPLDSLFSFELAHLKPPPPLPSLKLSKPKRDRKADLERKRKEREAEAAARALISGTRPRRKVITVVAAAAAIAVAADEEGEADAEAEAEGEEELPDMEMVPETETVPEAVPEKGAGEEQELEVEVEPERERGPEMAPQPELAPVPEPETERRAEKEPELRKEDATAEPGAAPRPVEPISAEVEASAPFLAPEGPAIQAQPSQDAATVRIPRKRGPQRRGSSLPSPSDAPPLVTDVDHKGSFKMFDKGWILPPEQKRGGRRPVERQPLPPRKRVKTGDYTASRLSVVSTSASDNQTLLQISPVVDTTVPPAPSEPSVPQERPVPIFEAMDVDTSALRTTISEDRTAPPTPREPSEVIRAPSVRAPSVTMEAAVAPPPPPPPPAPAPAPVPTPALAPPPAPAPPTPPSSAAAAPATEAPALAVQPVTPGIFNIDGIQPKRVVHGPDGQIIVEVLDSPLIRKQMTKLKKAERKRLMEQQQSGEPVKIHSQGEAEKQEPAPQAKSVDREIVPVAAAVAGPSRLAPGPDSVEAESELSSLSDLGSEAVEPKDREVYTPVVSSGRGRRRGPPRRMSVAIPGVSGDFGSIQKGQTLEGGTLVWAKAKTYPWWPAVVYEYDDPRIPLVVKMEGEGHIKRGSAIYMVQFFDRTRSWAFLSHDKLRMLGDHQGLDDDLLKKQRWKSPANKAECKLAYDEAMAEMETASDIARAEIAAVALEQETFQPTEVNMLEGDSSQPTATASGEGETDPITERHREQTPQSDKMQVDDEF